MRSPLILGLSMVLCIPVAYSHAKSSNIVNNESVQSILQGRTIKGQIIDENNEPLIGVSVTVKGANTIGTITDFDGNYTCLLYTSPSPRDKRQSRMPSSA